MRYAIEGKAVEIPTHSSNGVYSTLKVLYSLRSIAKNCSQEDINAMLIKHNFYDNDKNAKGTFTNDFEPKVINNDKVNIIPVVTITFVRSGHVNNKYYIIVRKLIIPLFGWRKP